MDAKTKKTTAEKVVVTESNIADYKAEIGNITAIPTEECVEIKTPPEKLITEAEALSNDAAIDRVALEKAGLAAGVIDRLNPAAGALRLSCSALRKVLEKEGWQEESKEASELLARIKHYFLFAYADRPEKIERVREICQGSSNDMKVQQLQDCSLFGLDNKEELERIGFDLTLLDKAAEMSARMGTMLGQHKSNAANVSEARIIRDKAYTNCKRLITEVRKYGQFVFYRDAAKLKSYTRSLTPRRKRHQAAGEGESPAVMSEAA